VTVQDEAGAAAVLAQDADDAEGLLALDLGAVGGMAA